MPPHGGPAAVFLPDQAFWRLKERLIQRTGHFFYIDKDALLWERLRPRLLQTGSRTCAEYLERLGDPLKGEAEWVALEARITIGETFFFRYAEQFAALRDTILPEIIRRNAASRRIRIWSAGCATGPEPYSLAILLRRLLGEAIDSWRIGITGTDINEAFLETARQASYGAWALRGLSTQEIGQDFIAAADGRHWALRPLHRAMVRFQRHNLLSLLDQRPALELTDYDLILCRNVLIYFHPETVPRLVHALAGRLAAEGWLLLGHAESSTSFDTILAPVSLPGTVAYRPRSTPALAAPPPVPIPYVPEPPAAAPVVPPAPPPLPARVVRTAPRPPASAVPAADDPLQAIRSRANQGDIAWAEQTCARALAADPTNASLHFYDGLLARSRNAPERAEAAFRRAIYLYNDFAMAHYHLGLLLTDAGRTTAGRRAIATAAQICARLPEDAAVPEGDDLTAGGLRDLARAHLAAGGTG